MARSDAFFLWYTQPNVFEHLWRVRRGGRGRLGQLQRSIDIGAVFRQNPGKIVRGNRGLMVDRQHVLETFAGAAVVALYLRDDTRHRQRRNRLRLTLGKLVELLLRLIQLAL